MKLYRACLVMVLGLSLMACFACAPKHQSPQYRAATGVNSFVVSVRAFQDAEIVAAHSKLVAKDVHKSIQEDVEKALSLGGLAERAVESGDLTTAQSYYNAALTALQDLDPKLVGIKNEARQQELKTLLSTAVAAAKLYGGVQ